MSHNYSKVANDGFENNVPSFIDQDNLIQPDEAAEPYTSHNGPTQSSSNANPQVIRPLLPIDANSHMFQINFYRKFFDLDSDTFFQKIQRASNPLNPAFSTPEEDQHDITELYGFIWITGTLIFLMFVSSTGSNILSEWLHDHGKSTKYEYSFELLTISISLFYGYNIIVPVGLYLITSYIIKFPERLGLTKLISIYGYTNLLWFPITLVNFLIVVFVNNKKHLLILNLLEWIIVLVSGAITGLSNTTKIYPLVKKNCVLLDPENQARGERMSQIIIGGLALAHLLFTVLVKTSFFGISS